MNQGTINLSNVLQRNRLSLNGGWNVTVDPYEMGHIGILGDRNSREFLRDHNPATLATASTLTSTRRRR